MRNLPLNLHIFYEFQDQSTEDYWIQISLNVLKYWSINLSAKHTSVGHCFKNTEYCEAVAVDVVKRNKTEGAKIWLFKDFEFLWTMLFFHNIHIFLMKPIPMTNGELVALIVLFSFLISSVGFLASSISNPRKQ